MKNVYTKYQMQDIHYTNFTSMLLEGYGSIRLRIIAVCRVRMYSMIVRVFRFRTCDPTLWLGISRTKPQLLGTQPQLLNLKTTTFAPQPQPQISNVKTETFEPKSKPSIATETTYRTGGAEASKHMLVIKRIVQNETVIIHFSYTNKRAMHTNLMDTAPTSIVKYLDWNNSLQVLKNAYNAKLFVLIIGPKGTGKTTLVRKFADMNGRDLYSINLSLRTRESHLVGTKTLDSGSIGFMEGMLVRSMKDGGLLYLDELNAAEPDVLLRLDEALDDRRQIVLKEAEGQIVKAHNDWFVIATINPLTHAGTKELPQQLLSRFPVRIKLDYPPDDIELEIIKTHVSIQGMEDHTKRAVKLANSLREAAAVEELYYSPSIRETIAFAKMIADGTKPKDVAKLVFANVYTQWGESEYRKVVDLIDSMFE